MNISLQETQHSVILIVDDVDENLMISSAILKKSGYNIKTAKSGAECIQAAHEFKPDLILLDINMPGMSGIDACEILKKDPQTENIPVIFLTAVADSSHIVRAFQTGGVDYIVKPFRAQELLSRVNVHVALQTSQRKLIAQNEHLEQLNKEKSEFLSIAAHDLKNPLSGIIGLAELLITRQDEHISEKDITDMSRQIKHSAQFMFEIVANLLDVNQIEDGSISLTPNLFDLYESVSLIVTRYARAAETKSISLDLAPQLSTSTAIFADEIATVQILDNIVSNAVKYSPIGKKVSISVHGFPTTETEKGRICVTVKDEGQGFTDEDKKHLFQKFSKLSARPTGGEHSTGLGLSIAKKLTDLMGANIHVESIFGQGATFTVDFPTTDIASQSINP